MNFLCPAVSLNGNFQRLKSVSSLREKWGHVTWAGCLRLLHIDRYGASSIIHIFIRTQPFQCRDLDIISMRPVEWDLFVFWQKNRTTSPFLRPFCLRSESTWVKVVVTFTSLGSSGNPKPESKQKIDPWKFGDSYWKAPFFLGGKLLVLGRVGSILWANEYSS